MESKTTVQLQFEVGYGREYMKHQFAGGRDGVDLLLQTEQCDAAFCDGPGRLDRFREE